MDHSRLSSDPASPPVPGGRERATPQSLSPHRRWRGAAAVSLLLLPAAPNLVYLFTTRPATFWLGQTLTSLLVLALPLLVGFSLRTALMLTMPFAAWTTFATAYAVATGLPPSVLALQVLREATTEELSNYSVPIALAAAGSIALVFLYGRLARACRGETISLSRGQQWLALGLLIALLGKDVARSGWKAGSEILFERVAKLQPFAPIVLLLRMEFGEPLIPDRVSVLQRYTAQQNPPTRGRELCVLVIGESARRDAFGLYNAALPTTPRLQSRDLIVFRQATSCGTATIQGVPILLTGRFPEAGEYLPFRQPGLVEAFRLAGFHTAWLSTQQADGDVCSFITAFTGNAEERRFLNGRMQRSKFRNPELKHDGILLDEFDRVVRESGNKRVFVVLHIEGSHMPYPMRYPADFEQWPVDLQARNAMWRWLPPYDAYQQTQLRNAYLNTVLYTDWFLDQLVERLDRLGGISSLIFLSDHGENDPAAPVMPAGHAVATNAVLDIPFLVWLSQDYRATRPQLMRALAANAQKSISAQDLFSTACGLHRIQTSAADRSRDLTSADYHEQQRHFLTLEGRIEPWPPVAAAH